MTPWETALAFVWRPENDGADNNSAPGEHFLTRWGVIDATWEHARDEGVVPDVDLSKATKEDLGNVLRVLFWNVCACDRMAAAGLNGIALMVFNMAMVAGVGRSAKLLQRLLSVTQDGVIGGQTLAAAASHADHDALIRALEKADDTFFASLAQAGRFYKGWSRRAADARVAALALEDAHLTPIAR